MLGIVIDLSQVLQPYPISKQEVRTITQLCVERVSWFVYNETRRLASGTLRQTRANYVRNLNQPEIGPLKGTITLTGQLPNMIEQGAPAFDMKIGLLNSPKAKTRVGRDGKQYKFITIPFRWATPGTVAESEVFSGTMDADVYALAKKLSANMTTFTGQKQIRRGLTGGDLAKTKFGSIIGVRNAFSSTETHTTYGQYTHKSPLQAGIRRQVSPYENALQSSYVSFRRVSSNSDKNSWIHPGFTAANFMTKALDNDGEINVITSNTIDEFLDGLGL